MPKCSMCNSEVGMDEGIQLMNDEHVKKAKGNFVCWSCWYSRFVDQPIVEDETTKSLDLPQLRSMRSAAERRRWRR